MSPETRNWLMRWSLDKRPQIVPPERFAMMPEDVFDYLPPVAKDGLLHFKDGSGIVLPQTQGWTQWAICTTLGYEPNRVGLVPGLPGVVICRCRNLHSQHFFVEIAGLSFRNPAPEWFKAKSFAAYQDAVHNAKEKIRHLQEREERKHRGR